MNDRPVPHPRQVAAMKKQAKQLKKSGEFATLGAAQNHIASTYEGGCYENFTLLMLAHYAEYPEEHPEFKKLDKTAHYRAKQL